MRAPSLRAPARARMVSTDSRRASSTKAQVFTTTRSAEPGPSAGARPSARRVPVNLSESTAFLGQPRVSTQKRRRTDGRVPVTSAPLPGRASSEVQLEAGTGPVAAKQPAGARERDPRGPAVRPAEADVRHQRVEQLAVGREVLDVTV